MIITFKNGQYVQITIEEYLKIINKLPIEEDLTAYENPTKSKEIG